MSERPIGEYFDGCTHPGKALLEILDDVCGVDSTTPARAQLGVETWVFFQETTKGILVEVQVDEGENVRVIILGFCKDNTALHWIDEGARSLGWKVRWWWMF
jgi:hypothetical protein